MSTPDIIVSILVLVTLTYASVLDLRKREVPEYTWVPAYVAAIVLNLISGNYELLHLLISLLPPVLLFVMTFLGLMGGADALALLLVALANPKFRLIPPSFLVLIYSLLPPLILMIYYVTINITKYRAFTLSMKCVNWPRGKFLIFILGRVTRIGTYLRKVYVYPLSIPVNRDTYLCRTHFSLSEEEEEVIRNTIIEKVKKGILSENDYIVITHGLPHILFFLIGYTLYLIIPEKVIMGLLLHLLHA